MGNSFPDPIPDPGQSKGKSFLIAAAAGVLVLALLAFFLWRAATHSTPATPPGSHAALTAEERAYISNVAIDHLDVTRAENFLHQEVTTISGEIVNSGNRSISSLTLTAEFFDQLGQIAQRETRTVLVPPAPPIPPGARREFEVSLDHVSSEWNMARPTLKVTALTFTK